MSNFVKFRDKLNKNIDTSTSNLYVSSINGNDLWDLYLASFPEGTNPVYKERTAHDCQCCRNFVRNCGNIIRIVDNQIQSIWRMDDLPYPFDVVAKKMADKIESAEIKNVLVLSEQSFGALQTMQMMEDGTIKTWNHYGYKLPKKYVSSSVDQVRGETKTKKEVFERALKELTVDSAQTVLELIDSNSLYRGEESKAALTTFLKAKKEFDKLPENEQDCWIWQNIDSPVARIRNTAMGALLIDLSNDVDINEAVGKFEAIMAPTNYKRPNAIFTKEMVKDAQTKIKQLGFENSLGRRFAVTTDITVNNVLFVDRHTRNKMSSDSIFDDLIKESAKKPKKLDRVTEVSINDFISKILPSAQSLEVMVENSHEPNFVSLISPQDPDSPSMFQWNNGFSWAYNGDITDSMRDSVVKLGGRVDGALRFTHSWNHTGQNQSLMDLHVFFPDKRNKISTAKEVHDNYPSWRRVGWNKRQDRLSGGVQDVDFVSPPGNNIPIENISFPDIKKMPEGTYVFKIHNWNRRPPNKTGFLAELEFGGQIYEYEYKNPLDNKEWITVATVTLKNREFTIDHILEPNSRSKIVWGISTNDFAPVSMMMYSPNHWDDNSHGNKHYMFILDGCKNEGSPRGFFNEFLKPDLIPHKRVFEALGSKMRVEPSDDQLSGLGFSSTQKQSVVLRVKSNTEQLIKVIF